MNDRPQMLQVVQEIEIDVPPERAFQAFTDPREIPRWWSEEGHYRTTPAEIDLRPGGRYRLAGKSARLGKFEVTGVYRMIDAPRRSVYTRTPNWQEEARDSVVDISLRWKGMSRSGVKPWGRGAVAAGRGSGGWSRRRADR